ncbi:quinol oxidase polypeptide I QoxB [Staphylococcus aureus]|uniref:Quinol oxidase polypeptide I QoxB n=1 Tax=Staphylococcus aureus TaxID=1280 RepID=A0A2X2JZS6_STAAU|nr:quinol oxidase polypeptide I QoxB [Staphylococcus aureus]
MLHSSIKQRKFLAILCRYDLFNLSFIIGGSPAAGWTNYAPLAGEFSPGPGVNYYLIAIQIFRAWYLSYSINFFVTILRCKTPTMKFMQMPMFTVTTFILH